MGELPGEKDLLGDVFEALPLKDAEGRVRGGLERREQLLEAIGRIGRQVLSTLDRERVFDTLAEELMRLGLFGNLGIEVVDGQRGTVEIARVCNVEEAQNASDSADAKIAASDRSEWVVGLVLDLEEDALRREVVERGETLVVEDWDERYDPRFGSPEMRADRVAVFIPVKKGEEVLAILTTDCRREEREQMLGNVEIMYPLFDQMAIALDNARLYEEWQRRHRQDLAEQAVRLRIASMRQPDDLGDVAEEIGAQLRVLGVEHFSCSIQIVDADGSDFVSISAKKAERWRALYDDLQAEKKPGNARDYPWVLQVWRTGETRYEPRIPAGSPMPEGWSLIDAPFARGTLAVNCRTPDAFSPGDIGQVTRFADLLSEGFKRFEDLVANEEARNKLEEQHALLEAVVEGSQDAIFVKDREGRYLLANSMAAAWAGRAKEEMIGLSNEDFYPPDLVRSAGEQDQRVLASGQMQIAEHSMPGADGPHILLNHKYPLRDSDGTILGIVGVARDITELRRRELRARVLERVRAEIWGMRTMEDIERVVRVVRQGLVEVGVPVEDCSIHYLEESEKQIITHTWRYYSREGVWRQENDADIEMVMRMWKKGEPTYRPDQECDDPQGEFAITSARFGHSVRSVVDAPYSHGTIGINSSRADAFSPEDIETLKEMAAVLNEGFARQEDLRALAERNQSLELEVAERRRAEAALRTARDELEIRVRERTADLATRNEDLETFSYSVSHDLRAPLRAVTGFAQILSERYHDSLDERGVHYLGNIIEAGSNMDRLIGDLLRYSQLGRKSVELAPVNLGEVLDMAVEMLALRLDETEGWIERGESWPLVLGNETMVRQLFANLLDNALTYRREGVPPRIELSYQAQDGQVVVCVADNGIGIPPEHLEKAFTIFQRLHPANRFPGGTGVGLAIVRKCAELMGGRVWVESEEGVGSRFFAQLNSSKT